MLIKDEYSLAELMTLEGEPTLSKPHKITVMKGIIKALSQFDSIKGGKDCSIDFLNNLIKSYNTANKIIEGFGVIDCDEYEKIRCMFYKARVLVKVMRQKYPDLPELM